MKLSELADILLVRTGQYIAGDLSSADLDIQKFWRIMKIEVAKYDKYSPIVRKQTLYINNSYPFSDSDLYGKPLWISKVIPTSLFVAPTWVFQTSNSLRKPLEFTWRFEDDILYTSVPGEVEVTGAYRREVIEITNSQNVIIDYSISSLSEMDTTFIDLCHGRFLMSIGGARRAFNIEGLPITTDGQELMRDGKEIYASANTSLSENSQKWYLALGT